MRIVIMFLAALASALFTVKASAADAVAARYHFAGAASLANDKNFFLSKELFATPAGKGFVNRVLDHWTGVFWNALQFDPKGDPSALLRPLLNELLAAESMASFGGTDKGRIDFVLAARLGAQNADLWQKNLEKGLAGPGDPLTAGGFTGRRWPHNGRHSFWMLRAGDWVVVGRGEDLQEVRDEYLKGIKQDNRPAPVTKNTWLSAEVDWPLLAAWTPFSHCPLKLARTIVDVYAQGGRFHATNYVSYAEAVPWESQPWRIPEDLVSDPLTSFTASRNIGAYLKPVPAVSRLSSNPLAGQLFCWGLRNLPVLDYAAWPVAQGTNAIRKLATEAPAALDPILQASDHSLLTWLPKYDRISWNHLPVSTPTLQAAHDKNGDFLLAKLLPIDPNFQKVPDALWKQFQDRNDLVYYDWEITGLRLTQWRFLSEMLPVFPPPTPEDNARRQKAAARARTPGMTNQPPTPLSITETWLTQVAPALGNTVTEAARTSPTELTVVRTSPFLFTGLELVLLSHWLADAPVGPIDITLLPKAKMTGTGIPKPH